MGSEHAAITGMWRHWVGLVTWTIGRESRHTPAGEAQNEATPPLGSGHGGGLASGKDSINNVSRDQRTYSDEPSREDALEEHHNHKMDRAVQAAQARADTKVVIAGKWRHWVGLATWMTGRNPDTPLQVWTMCTKR